MTKQWNATSEQLLRELAPQVLGAVARRFRDFVSAEDAVQEAMIAAFTQWPEEGIPENPRGWLIQVASRRMTDHVRSEIARREREAAVAQEAETVAPTVDIESDMDPDDTLILLFMCCHPALTPSSAIALTLRAVGGLTTAEIANAFLVPEATMAQRISRAKQRIRDSGVPFTMPEGDERARRLRSVLQVLYLVFNEGYTSSIGADLHRTELSGEAIRLARMLHAMLPGDGEVAGLLALMLLTDARRPARTGPGGELIPLAEQDRTRWNDGYISEGVALLTGALSGGTPGSYQIQAAIAALHDEAQTSEATDWAQILALYELLMQVNDSPAVALNHAAATAMAKGAGAGLELLSRLETDQRLACGHHLLAARAHMLEMAGEHAAARECYLRAAELTASLPQQRYLNARAVGLAD